MSTRTSRLDPIGEPFPADRAATTRTGRFRRATAPPRRRPRVLFVQSSRLGHHPRHHYRLAAAVQAVGYDVTTVAQPDFTPGHVDAVPMSYLPLRRTRLSRMLSGPVTMWRTLRLKPAVIHVVCLDLLPWAVAAKKLRKRVVVLYDSNEEYDTFMLVKDWLPAPARRPLQVLVRRLEPWLARQLDATTTALPATHERFTRAGLRSVLIRNFPPKAIISDEPRHREAEYDVLVGGTLDQNQISLLVATARRLADRRGTPARWLVVARDADDSDRQLLEDALAAEGLRDQFDLRYDVPFLEMKRVLRAARVAFIPYPRETNFAARVPIRIFEYMASGVPFVASDLPTTSEFLAGRGVARLVPPGDPEAYAEALDGLLADPFERREMAARGPDVVRELYNWENEADRLELLYSELAPRERRQTYA